MCDVADKLVAAGKAVVYSDSSSFKLALARTIAECFSNERKVFIVDYSGSYLRYLDDLYGRENILFNEICGSSSDILVLFDPPETIGGTPCSTIVLTTRGKRVRVRGLTKAIVREIQPNLYELKIIGSEWKIRLRREGLVLRPVNVNPVHDSALRLLTEAMSNFGEITVRDAVNILVANMGLSKGEARRVLAELASRKYISLKKGKIMLP